MPQEKMVFNRLDKDTSTWIKLTWDEDIPNPFLVVLPQTVPDGDGCKLLAKLSWIPC